MKILVCGSRSWVNSEILNLSLDAFLGDTVLVHGCARGADRMAHEYAIKHRWPVPRRYPADWDRYGKGAGPIRNREMLATELEGLDLVVAFRCKGKSNGTDDMCEISRDAGVEVVVIKEEDFDA